MKPRIAMLSYSNFGSSQTIGSKKIIEATELLKKENKNMIIDGEIIIIQVLSLQSIAQDFYYHFLGIIFLLSVEKIIIKFQEELEIL